MKGLTGRLGVGFMRVLALLPLPVLRGMGWLLGQVAFVLVAPRRKVALRNLALCFPDWSEARRRAVARASFVAFCQTWLDRSWLWAAPRSVVEQRVRLTGAVHELEGDTPTILFAPHFYGMDAGGLALPLRSSRAFTSIFATHPDPAVDAWFMAGRQRFGDVRMLNRSDGVKPIIASLRKGVIDYDRRHGYRGAEAHVDMSAIKSDNDEALDELLQDYSDPSDLRPAIVLEADTKQVKAYRRGGEVIKISGDGLRFATRMLDDKAPANKRLRRGAVIRVQTDEKNNWRIVQMPEVEAALLAADPQTGAIRALVGGFDFSRNKFNHVTQAWRQPGSSFKP